MEALKNSTACHTVSLVMSRGATLKPSLFPYDQVQGSGSTLRKGLHLQPERVNDIFTDLF